MSDTYKHQVSIAREIRETILEVGSPLPTLLISAYLYLLWSNSSPILFLFSLLFFHAAFLIFIHGVFRLIRSNFGKAWSDSIPSTDLNYGATVSEIIEDQKATEYRYPPISERDDESLKAPLVYGLRYFLLGIILYWVSLTIVAFLVHFGLFSGIVTTVSEPSSTGHVEAFTLGAESILGWIGPLFHLLLPDLSPESAVFYILIASLPSVPLLFAARNFSLASRAFHVKMMKKACSGANDTLRRESIVLSSYCVVYGVLVYSLELF